MPVGVLMYLWMNPHMNRKRMEKISVYSLSECWLRKQKNPVVEYKHDAMFLMAPLICPNQKTLDNTHLHKTKLNIINETIKKYNQINLYDAHRAPIHDGTTSLSWRLMSYDSHPGVNFPQSNCQAPSYLQ